MRRVLGGAAIAIAALALQAGQAQGAGGLFGTVSAHGTPSQAQFARMASGGVSTLRFVIPWRSLERNGSLAELSPLFWNWKRTDHIVRLAAREGVDLLPVLTTPSSHRLKPPRAAERETWAKVLAALADRYGPGGWLWTLDPLLPKRPIRAWQIWNEQNSPTYWRPAPEPGAYGSLVKLSATALRGEDPAARIVLGGMFGTPHGGRNRNWYSWVFLRRVLRVPGIRSSFDAVALHPYAATLRGVRWQIRRARRVLRRSNAGRIPIWITELGWTHLRKPRNPNVPVPANGERGQARKLNRAFRLLRARQRQWRLERVLWFSWQDSAVELGCSWCDKTGLLRRDGSARPAWNHFTKHALR